MDGGDSEPFAVDFCAPGLWPTVGFFMLMMMITMYYFATKVDPRKLLKKTSKETEIREGAKCFRGKILMAIYYPVSF